MKQECFKLSTSDNRQNEHARHPLKKILDEARLKYSCNSQLNSNCISHFVTGHDHLAHSTLHYSSNRQRTRR